MEELEQILTKHLQHIKAGHDSKLATELQAYILAEVQDLVRTNGRSVYRISDDDGKRHEYTDVEALIAKAIARFGGEK